MDLSILNDKQKEAVTSTEGRIRVVAGAGSGKTRALAYRYAYIVNELGIDPANILCLTFTNKAAQEMKSRISQCLQRFVHTAALDLSDSRYLLHRAFADLAGRNIGNSIERDVVISGNES